MRYSHILGDTIKIMGSFSTFEDVKIVPQNVQIKVYDSLWRLIETFPLTDDYLMEDRHTFQYNYTLSQLGTFYFEIYGIVEGTPSLNRIAIDVKEI